MRVAIVGAGLGGLTAAIALRQRGFAVDVYEQAGQLGEVGAGIQLGPNAMRVFQALGLEKEVISIAFEPDRHVVRNWNNGNLISATQMRGIYNHQYGAGYYGAHRADFHGVLVRALPPECIHLNAKLVNVSQSETEATLTFEGGRQVTSDVVIGADGIHSVVRTCLFGAATPRATGNICWRGLVPSDAIPKDSVSPDMNAYFGPNGTVVTYFVRRGEMVNWIAHFESDWNEESWRVQTDWKEVSRAYEGWHPTLAALFARTETCYKWALLDRDPLNAWTKGRVTLLGDAAHPMLPYLAQGAAMAVEDGYVIAALLDMYRSNPQLALKQYEQIRLPRTARVQLTARERSKTNHLTSPLARLSRDLRYRVRKWLRPNEHTYQIEWIYGHDVTARENLTMKAA
jgi:salicylate hydroxylase